MLKCAVLVAFCSDSVLFIAAEAVFSDFFGVTLQYQKQS